MGVPPQIKKLEARNEVVHAYSAHEKVHQHFGDLIKNVSLEAGVNQMAVWAKKTGSRQGRPFEGIEVAKNLPPSWAKLAK
jgi:UDP-glucose 4-epimerase